MLLSSKITRKVIERIAFVWIIEIGWSDEEPENEYTGAL